MNAEMEINSFCPSERIQTTFSNYQIFNVCMKTKVYLPHHREGEQQKENDG